MSLKLGEAAPDFVQDSTAGPIHFYEWVGKLTLSVDSGAVSVAAYELLPVDAAVAPFPQFAPVIQQVEQAVGDLFGDVHARVAFASFGVSNAPGPVACMRDTGAGNLVTDATRARTRPSSRSP